jgi:hypothetical protein
MFYVYGELKNILFSGNALEIAGIVHSFILHMWIQTFTWTFLFLGTCWDVLQQTFFDKKKGVHTLTQKLCSLIVKIISMTSVNGVSKKNLLILLLVYNRWTV